MEPLTLENVMLGIPNAKIFVNTLLLMTKYMIYTTRNCETDISVIHVRNYVKAQMKLEEYTAKVNGRFDTFLGKWADIYE